MALVGTIRRAIGRAFAKLDDLAGDVVIRQVTTTYDPLTGNTNEVLTNFTVEGVFDEYKQDEFDGMLIKQGDRRLYIIGSETDLYTPTIGDKVVDENSIEWEVRGSRPIRPYDATFVYEIQLRK